MTESPIEPGMSTPFKDHFSGHAATYSMFRPTYPRRLFEWLAETAPRRERAWDAGTGSGQAAVGLAEHFACVVGTDASAAQVGHATPHPRVEYRVAPAEASGLPEGWADLVTVAQALHWFDLPRFFGEARRVLAPDGLLAVWCYGDCRLDDPAVDRIVHRYNRDTVEDYWPPERDLVLAEYRPIPFPFAEVATPALFAAGGLDAAAAHGLPPQLVCHHAVRKGTRTRSGGRRGGSAAGGMGAARLGPAGELAAHHPRRPALSIRPDRRPTGRPATDIPGLPSTRRAARR